MFGGYVPCPALTPKEVDYFTKLAETTAGELVVCSALEGGPIQWKPRGGDDNLHVYEGLDTTTMPHDRVWCAKSQIQASIEEVQMMSYMETSEDYNLFNNRFVADVQDSARLYNVMEPSEKKPLDSVQINWVVQKSPGKGLLRGKSRDWCFVEGQFETEYNGRRAWVRSFRSIQLGCCPDLKAKCGYVRGTYVRSGLVFLETDRPGYLTVTQYNHDFVKGENQGGKLSDWFNSSSMLNRYRKIFELEATIRKYRLTNSTFLPLSQVVPSESRHLCKVCDQPFGKNKKLHCRKCGEVVCRECSKVYELNINGQWGEVRVCEPCVFGKVETLHKRLSKTSFHSDGSSVRNQPSSTWDSEEDNESLCNTMRDTLIEEPFELLHSSFDKPMYRPAMASKFKVDSFFTIETQKLEPPRGYKN